jgi:hypothetical protein
MLRNILETEQIMLLFFTCPLILYRNFFQCIDNWIGTWKLYALGNKVQQYYLDKRGNGRK